MASSEKRKRVRYVGNGPREAVPLPDGSQVFCDNGKSVEVPASVAKGLLSSDAWDTGARASRAKKPRQVPDPDKTSTKAGN